MSIKEASANSSLIFYSGKNYAGTAQQVTHGVTGELAASSASWVYQSVSLSVMEAYVFSTVNTADSSVNYLGHVEDVVSVSQADLTLLYPSSDQYPMNYLGLDPAKAVLVWLAVDATQAAPNAVASTALVGGGGSSITTLSLPGRPGALGFVAKTEGSSVVASCRYGDYNSVNGTVTWNGTGTLILEYTGGSIVLINGGGFPEDWTFSAPQLQGDGSWMVTLGGGIPASDTISSVAANPTSIRDDGISSSEITATVLDGSNQPAKDVDITWSTTLGNLSVLTSVTDSNGMATTILTDNGDTGTATVTASLNNGRTNQTTVYINASPSLIAYVTDAPALSELNDDETYQPTNKVVIYGEPGDVVRASIKGTNTAVFVETNSVIQTVVLPVSGRVELAFTDTEIETVYLDIDVNGESNVGAVKFQKFTFRDNSRLAANSGAPADGKSINSIYFDSKQMTPDSMTVTLSGGAVFNDTRTQQRVYNFSGSSWDATFDVVSYIPGTMTVECDAGSDKIQCDIVFSSFN